MNERIEYIIGKYADEAKESVRNSANAGLDAFTGDMSRLLAEELKTIALELKSAVIKENMYRTAPLSKNAFGGGLCFDKGSFERALSEHELFKRRFENAVESWKTLYCAFLEALENDRALLESSFGIKEKDMPARAAGLRRGGVQPAFLSLLVTFESGKRVCYKRGARDISVYKGLEALNALMGGALRVPAAMESGGVWREYIEHTPVASREAAEKFFFNGGVLLSVVRSLGGRDMHCGNIIACKEFPVPIDTETLLVPETDAKLDIPQKIRNSVLGTQMLPTVICGERETDIGALTGGDNGDCSLPVFGGRRFSGEDYARQIASGYETGIKLLGKAGADAVLKCFENAYSRVIVRSNRFYAILIDRAFSPSIPRDEKETKAMLRITLEKFGEPKGVREAEISAMLAHEIPRFYMRADSRDIMSNRKTSHEDYARKSAITRARECFEAAQRDSGEQVRLIYSILQAKKDGSLKNWREMLAAMD